MKDFERGIIKSPETTYRFGHLHLVDLYGDFARGIINAGLIMRGNLDFGHLYWW